VLEQEMPHDAIHEGQQHDREKAADPDCDGCNGLESLRSNEGDEYGNKAKQCDKPERA
jgi:hypothetical protein